MISGLLALCLEIIADGLWDAGDQTLVCHVEGKCPTCYRMALFLLPFLHTYVDTYRTERCCGQTSLHDFPIPPTEATSSVQKPHITHIQERSVCYSCDLCEFCDLPVIWVIKWTV